MPAPTNVPSDPTTDKPPRRQRWIPLSLRMFIAILATSVVAGVLWIGVPAYRQYVAIREITRVGGTVETQPGGPEWLRELLGDERMEWFEDLVRVRLEGTPATDATLVYLSGLPKLHRLDLFETEVTDAGLAHIARLSTLRVLALDGTRVSDAGVADLQKELPDLKIDK